jgi:hypothetical protein
MTPLQAAARAIYAADPQLGTDGPVPWDQQHTPLRAVCVAQARAAVKAIQHPDEAMLEAARNWSRAKYGIPIGNEAASQCWQVMIDVILADP